MGTFPFPNTNNRFGAACEIRRNGESTSPWRFCWWCDGLVASETYFNRAADGFVHVPKRITMFLFPENLRYLFMSLTVTALFAASLLLGGDFVCGEVVWWRDKRISIVPWLGLANRRPLYIYSSTSVITRKGFVEKAVIWYTQITRRPLLWTSQVNVKSVIFSPEHEVKSKNSACTCSCHETECFFFIPCNIPKH